MLSAELNDELTQVSAGTPMGELMRRYWHPVAATMELEERPTKAVRLLGEDLVLYKDRSDTYGLIDRLCPHRRVDLTYGIPEEHGLRCMYHGWMYDETGQCIEQPFEETVHPDGRFKEKVKIAGYPVEELGGLLFAYMGPHPAPLLPRWEQLLYDDAVRDIAISQLPCNWLQCQENSLDAVHSEWLHFYFGNYVRTGNAVPDQDQPTTKKIAFAELNTASSSEDSKMGSQKMAKIGPKATQCCFPTSCGLVVVLKLQRNGECQSMTRIHCISPTMFTGQHLGRRSRSKRWQLTEMSLYMNRMGVFSWTSPSIRTIWPG